MFEIIIWQSSVARVLQLDLVDWLTPCGTARDLRYGLLGDRRDDASESSTLGSVEIVCGVAIAAAVCEIGDSSCRSHLRSVMAPSCLLNASRAWERCWEPGSHGLWGLAQPGRGRASVLKSCWASSSREHRCSNPSLDQDWSVQCWPMGYAAVPCLVRSDAGVRC